MKLWLPMRSGKGFKPAAPGAPAAFRFPGRKPLDYRKILTCILFVLKTGIAWE
jgi:hypothetical protein